MGRIVIDYFRRYWGWFVAAEVMSAVLALPSREIPGFPPLEHLVVWVGGAVLLCDLQRRPARAWLSLPVTRKGLGWALWFCSVAALPLLHVALRLPFRVAGVLTGTLPWTTLPWLLLVLLTGMALNAIFVHLAVLPQGLQHVEIPRHIGAFQSESVSPWALAFMFVGLWVWSECIAGFVHWGFELSPGDGIDNAMRVAIRLIVVGIPLGWVASRIIRGRVRIVSLRKTLRQTVPVVRVLLFELSPLVLFALLFVLVSPEDTPTTTLGYAGVLAGLVALDLILVIMALRDTESVAEVHLRDVKWQGWFEGRRSSLSASPADGNTERPCTVAHLERPLWAWVCTLAPAALTAVMFALIAWFVASVVTHDQPNIAEYLLPLIPIGLTFVGAWMTATACDTWFPMVRALRVLPLSRTRLALLLMLFSLLPFLLFSGLFGAVLWVRAGPELAVEALCHGLAGSTALLIAVTLARLRGPHASLVVVFPGLFLSIPLSYMPLPWLVMPLVDAALLWVAFGQLRKVLGENAKAYKAGTSLFGGRLENA